MLREFLEPIASQLTEKQAQLLIADAIEQRRQMFEVEATWR